MNLAKKVLLTIACLSSAGVSGCRAGQSSQERYLDVDAGGHRLHMLVVGRAGPVVVLETGWPGCGIGWDRVRGSVARFATVVTYDQAGTGKSEPGPMPRHAQHIAGELHTALRNAGLAPPYILVGQSWGGPCIRVFAGMYPDDVAGMVLVDPSQPEACAPVSEVKQWLASHCPGQLERAEKTFADKAPPGLEIMLFPKVKRLEEVLAEIPEPRRTRLRQEWWGEVDNLPDVQTTLASISPGARAEMAAGAETFRQAVAARPLPNVLITLLSAGRSEMDATQAMSPGVRDLNAGNRLGCTAIEVHAKWVAETPGAKLVVVRNSGHNIQKEQPQFVIDAIREVVGKANHRNPARRDGKRSSTSHPVEVPS